MATHYKGQRIDELLGEIATIQATLDGSIEGVDTDPEINWKFSQAYTAITIAKAKLTALQGDDK